MNIQTIFNEAANQHASDIHLTSNHAPRIRIDGDLIALNQPPLDNDAMLQIVHQLLSNQQRLQWQQQQELDFAYCDQHLGRLRGNVVATLNGPAIALRIVGNQIPTLTQLNLPPQIEQLCQLHHGLLLVTGPTGCGKSSTLAAMINAINESRACHIVTIEDPIEFCHQSKRALIQQRQIGEHSRSFYSALHALLRQDPDIILIGELRDSETVRLALTAAETGHLVLSTLHTCSASDTLYRLINLFPGNEKAMMRTIIAASLQAVVAQQWVKRKPAGRSVICEIMRTTDAIRHMIRDDRIAQIPSAIQSGSANGMITMAQSLAKWQQSERIR